MQLLTFCASTKMAVAKKPRTANWSSEEMTVLIEATLEREERLFGKIKGSGATGKVSRIRDDAWQEVADTLNA